MPYICYEKYKFRRQALDIIDIANKIIEEYRNTGYDLTLRQLYYQFVAKALIPNSEKSYNNLGGIISRARLAGWIDWNAIIDRTRINRGNTHWDSPQEIIQSAANSFALDTRETQDIYMEVWVEKDALVDVVGQICRELDVPYFSCRGYVSQSAMWKASLRFIKAEKNNKETIIFHLGDHDPSGIDMTRDIQDRLHTFLSDVQVQRIALTMDQIDEHNPPPNPAKITDSRSDSYISQFGNESWELDALDPRTIAELIREKVEEYTDEEKRQLIINKQESQRKRLLRVAKDWEKLFKKGNQR